MGRCKGASVNIELGWKRKLVVGYLVILMTFNMSDWKGWQKGTLVVDLLNEIPVSSKGGRGKACGIVGESRYG